MSGGERFRPGSAAAVAREINRLFRDTPFETVRRALTEHNDADEVNAGLGPLGEFLDHAIDDEIVLDFTGATGLALDQDALYRGRQGWVDLWRSFIAPWDDFRIVDEEFVELDFHRAIAIAKWHLRGSAGGVPVTIPNVGLWMVRDGRVVRVGQFDSVEQCRAAAERPEWRGES